MAEIMPVAGRYALKQLLGSGGEASVYAAFDLKSELWVAVRLPDRPGNTHELPPRLPPMHPNWVRLLDGGYGPGPRPFSGL